MAVIDVTSGLTGLTGPIPWVPGLPLAARLGVLVAALTLAAAAAVAVDRRSGSRR